MGLNLRKYSGIILAIVLVQLILVSAAWATPQKVYFAGFAFLSDAADIRVEYPFSSQIVALRTNDGEDSKIEEILRQKVDRVTNSSIKIVKGNGVHDSGDAFSLALVLDWEDVCIEELESDLFKIVLNLHGQILVYDFTEMQIVTSYPFGVRINDISKTKPGKDHIQNLFYRLYFEKIDKINFLDEFTNKLQQIQIKESYNHRLKVTEVVIDAKSHKFMPEKVKTNLAAYKNFVAQQFSAFLSTNQKVAVLPYTEKNEQKEQIIKGQAITGKMALRFENATVLNLTVPEEDIPIKLKVRGFKKVELGRNHRGTSWVYGSFIRFTVLDPLGGSVVNAKFKYAAVKKIPASQTKVTIESDWSAFEESLLALFDELTQQISERSSSWISKKTKDKRAKSQLKELEKLLRKI